MELPSFFVYCQFRSSIDAIYSVIMNQNIKNEKKVFVRPVVNVVEIDVVCNDASGYGQGDQTGGIDG